MAYILIVDDDDVLLSSLKRILTGAGHAVKTVPAGGQAQFASNLEKFDLVISDVRMPEVNGVEVLEWMKARHGAPVILMSGFNDSAEKDRALDLGADGFLAKPFDRKGLLQAIEDCLGARRGDAAPLPAAAQPAPNGSDERKFLHDLANPLATATLLTELALGMLRSGGNAPDLESQLASTDEALKRMKQLLQERREELIRRGVPSSKKK